MKQKIQEIFSLKNWKTTSEELLTLNFDFDFEILQSNQQS